ncbi:MAG: hypothetical protein ACYSTX_00290 [Planctomycetota bacterium]|jgi:hypothetical protein
MNDIKESPVIYGHSILFINIFRAFKISRRLWNIAICFLALAIIFLAGVFMDLFKTVVVAKDIRGNTELEVFINNSAQIDSYIAENKSNDQRKGVFSTLWHFAEKKFQAAVYSVFNLDIPGVLRNIGEFFKAIIWAIKYHWIYSPIFFVISLSMISIAGGSVCRTAALQFAQGQKPGMTEAIRYSTKKFKSYFSAPLLPIFGIFICGFLIFISGLIATIPGVGEIIMVIFLVLSLILGATIVALLIVAVAGFNLIFPSIAYEGTDNFGAVDRAFCYIFKKPWRLAFYTAIATIYGAISYAFVRLLVFLLLWSTNQSLQLGSKFISSVFKNSSATSKFNAIWPEPTFMNLFGTVISEPAGWSQVFAAFVVHLIIWIFVLLLAAFIMSFYFSANTIIYALMRNRIDNTPISNIYASRELELEGTELNETVKLSTESESSENNSNKTMETEERREPSE